MPYDITAANRMLLFVSYSDADNTLSEYTTSKDATDTGIYEFPYFNVSTASNIVPADAAYGVYELTELVVKEGSGDNYLPSS
jgi:hypothetical protein